MGPIDALLDFVVEVDDNVDIEDGLGRKPREGRRADVLDACGPDGGQNPPQRRCDGFELAGPLSAAVDDLDTHGEIIAATADSAGTARRRRLAWATVLVDSPLEIPRVLRATPCQCRDRP